MTRTGRMWLRWLMVVLAAGVSAPLHAADDQVHVVPFAQLEQWWQVPAAHPNEPPPYPAAALAAGAGGCIAVAFLIRSDGSTTAARVWRTGLPHWNARVREAMEISLLQAVRKWRFFAAPTNTNRAPVYTYQIVTYDIGGGGAARKLRHHELEAPCKITNFQQQVEAMVKARSAEPKP